MLKQIAIKRHFQLFQTIKPLMLKQQYRAINWVSALLFLSLSSFLSAWIFEWDRHYFNCDPMFQIMSASDKALLFWFLAAKSVAWFLPFIVIYWCLLALTFERISNIFLNILWLFTFFVMITDLFAYSIQGLHAVGYLKFCTVGIVETPQLVFSRIWRFAGIRLIGGAVFILAVFVISGPVFFFTLRSIVTMAMYRFDWLISRRSLATLTICFILFSLGIVPLQKQFRDRVVNVLPLAESHKELLGCIVDSIQIPFGLVKQDLIPEERTDHNMGVSIEEHQFVTKLVNDEMNHATKRTHSTIIPERPNAPNVVIIVAESFRFNTIDPCCMKDLDEWAKQGLSLKRHYSGSNTTRPGLFSLLSGQVALHQIRDAEIGFQMIELLKKAGYQTTFITYRDTLNVMGIEDWYSSIPCDNFIQRGEYDWRQEDRKVWTDSDSKKMKDAMHVLNTSTDRPNFVLVFLLSSHFPYAFTPEFEIFKSFKSFWRFFNPRYKIQQLLNQYTNSMLFLEKEIIQFVHQLDMSRNIVIVTGDHGESMKEDGVFFHGTRPSEAQLRVPFIMRGPGIEQREILTATAHNDVLPTLFHAIAGENVPTLNSNGRDLLADPMPADEVVVAPYRDSYWPELLFIRGDRRLVFKPSTDSDNSTKPEFIGIVDEAGQYKLRVSKVRQTSELAGNSR